MRGFAALAIITCLTLFASFLYIADRSGTPPAGPSTAYLPADGHNWFDLETVDDGAGQWQRLLAVENARLAGPAAVQSLDGALADVVAGSLGVDQLMGDHYWRATSTLVDPGVTEQQTVRLYRAAPDVALVAESEATMALVYDPPLVLLPEDPEPGRSWDTAGQTSMGFGYDASFTLARTDGAGTDGDCVVSEGKVDYVIGGLDLGLTRTVAYTWCPGQGIVRTAESAEGSQVMIERTSHAHTAPEPEATPRTWGDPASWQEHRRTARSVHGALGESPIASATSPTPAALTDSGLLVRSSRSGDLVVLAPDGGEHLTLAWTAHPGGQILRVAAVGDIIVATTSLRQIVAYSSTGVRLWTAEAGDAVMTPPVALHGGATIVMVTVSGEALALRTDTGAPRWRVQTGSDVGADPVVAGTTILIGTRTGRVVALDGDDGGEIWRAEVPSALTLAASEQVAVVAGYTSLTGVDLTDGTPLWTSSLTGRVRSMAATTDAVVVATDASTYALSADGAARWSRSGAAQVVANGAYLAVLDDDGVAVLTADGHQIGAHRVGVAGLSTFQQLLVMPQGVGLVADSWDLRMWQP